MQPKHLATVRVSNLTPDLQESERLHKFLGGQDVVATSKTSLCPHSGNDSSKVATVTFLSQSSAKKALKLNGRVLDGRNVSIERKFMGLTVLASPEKTERPHLE